MENGEEKNMLFNREKNFTNIHLGKFKIKSTENSFDDEQIFNSFENGFSLIFFSMQFFHSTNKLLQKTTKLTIPLISKLLN